MNENNLNVESEKPAYTKTAQSGETRPCDRVAATYFLLNATLDITHQQGGTHTTENVVEWASACLNCNPMHAEVKVTLATPFLSWADFMDAPGFGPEHPDYADTIDHLEKLNYWLTLDRKDLVSELVRYYTTAKCERTLKERAEQKIRQASEFA